jgi:hypothetical protein
VASCQLHSRLPSKETHPTPRTCMVAEVELQAFLTSPADEGRWSVSSRYRFNSGRKAPGSHSLGRAVGLGAGLIAVEKIVFPVSKVKPIPVLQVVAQSLYRLSYSGSFAPIPSQITRNLHAVRLILILSSIDALVFSPFQDSQPKLYPMSLA